MSEAKHRRDGTPEHSVVQGWSDKPGPVVPARSGSVAPRKRFQFVWVGFRSSEFWYSALDPNSCWSLVYRWVLRFGPLEIRRLETQKRFLKSINSVEHDAKTPGRRP